MAVKINFTTDAKARDEEVARALAWVGAKMGDKLTPALKETYKTGLQQGWDNARAFYRMHGAIEIDY